MLHSEHVISRSGIAVSPREQNRGVLPSLLFGALASGLFQPLFVIKTFRDSNTTPESLSRPDTVYNGSVLQQMALIQIFIPDIFPFLVATALQSLCVSVA